MAILLADIGGTNARFRWLKDGRLGVLFNYKCDDFKTPYEVISEVLTTHPQELTGIVLAGAGPVQKASLKWTNRPKWKISEREIKKQFHIRNILIINDVQAQGEGLKTLYKCLKTSVLMTAGTGLGGCFIADGKIISGEIGQIKLDEKLKLEDFVSGAGIVRLYHQYGGNKKINSAHQIEKLRKTEKAAELAYQTFYKIWGKTAAQLVTAFYATGGVYLWGGLIPNNQKDKAVFIKSYQKMLPTNFQKISVQFVTNKTLAFKGLRSLSHREFGQS